MPRTATGGRPGRPRKCESGDRVASWRERMDAAGLRSKSFLLPCHVVAALHAGATRAGLTERDYLAGLILAREEVI